MIIKTSLLVLISIVTLILLPTMTSAHPDQRLSDNKLVRPLISDWMYLGNNNTPPSQTDCNNVSRRCFSPSAIANSYNYSILHTLGNKGKGKTIAIIDSFGSTTIESDLKVFDAAFGLPDPPSFKILEIQGSPPPVPPPPNDGTGLENHNLWALEVSLDVEWAHATAPEANILLVTTPTAETLGVQGFEQMMNAEQYVIDNHMADVISQSFGSGEGAWYNGSASIRNLRKAFMDAQKNNVTVLASSGDGGSTNTFLQPIKNPAIIPYPSVIWPASDPLVTAVGGTYLCTNAITGIGIDSVSPPVNCQNSPNDREPAWVASGGGYSILFSRPDYQDLLPPGSTYVGSSPGAPGQNNNMRGVPDIAYQASSRTGVLVYMNESISNNQAGTGCGGANPCSTGWYVVGGTSSGAPQWAGIIAMADQISGRNIGFINPALYKIANDPVKYATDFYDPHVNNNGCCGEPGWPASEGWDAVTGLGTPNVGNLIPDLIAASS